MHLRRNKFLKVPLVCKHSFFSKSVNNFKIACINKVKQKAGNGKHTLKAKAEWVLLYFSAVWFLCYPFRLGKRIVLSLDLVMLQIACLKFCISVIRMKDVFEIYWESGCMKGFQCFELISLLLWFVKSFGNKVQKSCRSVRIKALVLVGAGSHPNYHTPLIPWEE